MENGAQMQSIIFKIFAPIHDTRREQKERREGKKGRKITSMENWSAWLVSECQTLLFMAQEIRLLENENNKERETHKKGVREKKTSKELSRSIHEAASTLNVG